MLNLVKFKDQVFPDYRIDTETAEIFDWNGNSLPTYKNHDDRSMVKIPGLGAVPVYQIQGNSFFEYKSGFDIHHKDFNKLNDALSNLDYIPHGEHTAIHKHFLNHIHSDTTKELISKRSKEMWQKDGYREMMHEKLTGKCNGMYGKHHSAETRALISEHRKGISVYYSLSEEKKAELKAELSEKFSGVKNPAHAKHWWHKNDEYIFANECPGEGWELGGRHCSKETADKIRKANSGRKFTEEHRKKISEAAKARDPKKNGMYGKHHSQESIEKMKKTREERKNTYAVWNKGLKLKPLSDEQKHVLSDKMSNMFWWNDGKINKRFRECPGEGWIKGRLKRVN